MKADDVLVFTLRQDIDLHHEVRQLLLIFDVHLFQRRFYFILFVDGL